MSLHFVVLEQKSFVRTRTPKPESDDIMSADWQVSWHKNENQKKLFITVVLIWNTDKHSVKHNLHIQHNINRLTDFSCVAHKTLIYYCLNL